MLTRFSEIRRPFSPSVVKSRCFLAAFNVLSLERITTKGVVCPWTEKGEERLVERWNKKEQELCTGSAEWQATSCLEGTRTSDDLQKLVFVKRIKMRRGVVRMRQEFLERRQNESVHESINARKGQLRQALDTATPMPGHLRKDALTLKKFVELDDDKTKNLQSTVDDEYALAGVEDPKILVTTSRNASQKLMEFTKEIRLVLPNALRVNRGSTSVTQLVESARKENVTDIVLISESKGIPDTITISHLPMGPTIVFTIHNIVTRHDLENVGPMSEQAPHLIFENFTTKLGERIKSILRYLFPVPRPDATRVVTFDNNNDFVSFRHHTFKKTPRGEVLLTEVGPRFELQPFRILQGTLEMDDADLEWVMHPFINTAKKRRLL